MSFSCKNGVINKLLIFKNQVKGTNMKNFFTTISGLVILIFSVNLQADTRVDPEPINCTDKWITETIWGGLAQCRTTCMGPPGSCVYECPGQLIGVDIDRHEHPSILIPLTQFGMNCGCFADLPTSWEEGHYEETCQYTPSANLNVGAYPYQPANGAPWFLNITVSAEKQEGEVGDIELTLSGREALVSTKHRWMIEDKVFKEFVIFLGHQNPSGTVLNISADITCSDGHSSTVSAIKPL